MTSYFQVFASPVDVDVSLEGEDDRKQVEVKQEKEKTIKCPVYYDGESLVGQVSGSVLLQGGIRVVTCGTQATVRVRDGKKLAHDGIKIEFVGSIGALFALSLLRYSNIRRIIL